VAYYGGVITDVTERRREEELIEAKEEAEKARREAEKSRREAERAREEAEEASRLKSSFLANMSHEIRTPLTSIIGFAEALGTEASELEIPGSSTLPRYAALIEQSGKRLMQTLNGVLNLSQLEAGQMELSSEPVSLADQARRATASFYTATTRTSILPRGSRSSRIISLHSGRGRGMSISAGVVARRRNPDGPPHSHLD